MMHHDSPFPATSHGNAPIVKSPVSVAVASIDMMHDGLNVRIVVLFMLAFMAIVVPSLAQLSMSGQVRIRSELRDGQGSPSLADTVPAFFISQRTRINVGFTGYRFKLYTAVQDVRVWGQDASTINRVTPAAQNSLMIHEAW